MRRKRQRRHLSLTSLIDVIFLLLLFFMLSSTFSKYAEIQLPLGGSGINSSEGTPFFLRISADVITLNGKPTTLEDLSIRFSDHDQPTNIIVSATSNATSQQLIKILSKLQLLSETNITVLVPA